MTNSEMCLFLLFTHNDGLLDVAFGTSTITATKTYIPCIFNKNKNSLNP